MPERSVISNTSPLLYLHQIGQLDLLPKLYGRVVIPPAVRKELRTGADRGISTPDVDQIPWLDVRTPTDMTLLPLAIDLGAGEAEAIALALASCDCFPRQLPSFAKPSKPAQSSRLAT